MAERLPPPLCHFCTAPVLPVCAAVPLCAQVRNVEGGVHGRHELDTTGPLLAGACLRKLYRTMGNFSMALTHASDPSRSSTAGGPARKAIYLDDLRTRAVRLHAFDARHASNGTRAHGYVDYARAWRKTGAFAKNCSAAAQHRAGGWQARRRNLTEVRLASKATFERLAKAVVRGGGDEGEARLDAWT